MTDKPIITKFTPGPWVVEPTNYDGDGGTLVRLTGSISPNCVANVWGTESAQMPNAESIANAHLIAAAPDLYAALEAAMYELAGNGYRDDEEPLRRILSALSKARGEA